MKLRSLAFALLLTASALIAAPADRSGLASAFASPPGSARPWVFWFWINGNISKEGITADLEAMKQVGVGGLIWMEVSGPWWAPAGKVRALTPEWHDCMQWALRECDRLGLQFDLSVDFGYGSGGPEITPDRSMQKLYWSETPVHGGAPVRLAVPKPDVPKKLSAWLRPDAQINPAVLDQINRIDSYRDVAVLALPLPAADAARKYRIPDLEEWDGSSGTNTISGRKPITPPAGAITPTDQVIDLTSRLQPDGTLAWEPPAGEWLILRVGHASNFKMTRPSPAAAVGLECDRLSPAGIDAHFDGFLKKIFADAGPAAGRALTHVHIDSWEAGGQNWTASFPAEFRRRRGYDLRPWLPILTGRVVGSVELTQRFLWDVRCTVSELICDNYAARLQQLAKPYGIQFSAEAYGRVSVNDLAYGGVADLPIGEFWARGTDPLPASGSYPLSTKLMSSAAHTHGRSVVAAESFTSNRGWRDHPYLLKAMGDGMFTGGLNRMVFHLSAHQAYDTMIPGLTHRKWGEHFNRFNTWWSYSDAWIRYLWRSQYVLQQGRFVADLCYWYGEGAPIHANDVKFTAPAGYDVDFASSDVVAQMSVRGGRLVLPSGASYRYLLLPDSDRMTLPMARKIRELALAGARIIAQQRPVATPGLTNLLQADVELGQIVAELWNGGHVISGRSVAEVFAQANLPRDFEGGDLRYIHRQIGEQDAFFVSNQEHRAVDVTCAFRVTGKRPQLWDAESGAIRDLPEFTEQNGRITVPLHFEPAQSWFVVFAPSTTAAGNPAGTERNFEPLQETRTVDGSWNVTFEPRWGGPAGPVAFDQLTDWSRHADPRIHYYSGTAVYRKALTLSEADLAAKPGALWLDLGKVEVMARVLVNGTDCGVAWKPPYRIDISGAVRAGDNTLEVRVVNLWINRMIGDEQLPLDADWKDFETLAAWPDWFKNGTPRPSGRYTFTTCRHYRKDTPLVPSGLLGPVKLLRSR